MGEYQAKIQSLLGLRSWPLCIFTLGIVLLLTVSKINAQPSPKNITTGISTLTRIAKPPPTAVRKTKALPCAGMDSPETRLQAQFRRAAFLGRKLLREHGGVG